MTRWSSSTKRGANCALVALGLSKRLASTRTPVDELELDDERELADELQNTDGLELDEMDLGKELELDDGMELVDEEANGARSPDSGCSW